MTTAGFRPIALLALVGALSLLATACGSAPQAGLASVGSTTTTTPSKSAANSGSSGQSGATQSQLVKYAVCMRSHGEPNFPDPVPAQGGGFAFDGYGTPGGPLSPTVLQSPQYHAAVKACEKDVPPGLAHITPAKAAASALRYSQCMRKNGEPNFPDPNAQGVISMNPTGIMDPNAPQFQRAEKACRALNNGTFDMVDTRRVGD